MSATPVMHGPWLVIASLLLVAGVARRGTRPPAAEVWLVAMLTGAAALLRTLCGVWGPMHVNGQGPFWVRGALEPQALAAYGPGYFELFNPVTRLGTAPDYAVFAANAALSALAPALLYLTGRLIGVSRAAALTAALVLAADAVSVRTAASEAYFTSLSALVLGVEATLALALRARGDGDRPGAALALAAACLLAAATARIHAAAYLPLALGPLVVLGAAQPPSGRTRAALAAIAGAAIGAVVLLTSGDILVSALGAAPGGSGFGTISSQTTTLLFALLALLWLLRRRADPAWLPLLGVASLVLMLATRETYARHPLWALFYDRLFWPGILLGAAALWPQRLQRPRWALAVGTVGAVALALPALPYLRTRTTEQLEYAFLRRVLGEIPSGCAVAGVSRAGRRVWDIPAYLVSRRDGQEGQGVGIARADDLRDAVAPGPCLLYVHSSLCSSADARELCESAERAARLEPLATSVFPALPSYLDLPYDRPQVDVAVFRVLGHRVAERGPAAVVGDGVAITPEFAQAVHERLTPLHAPDDCQVTRLDTARFSMTVGVRPPGAAEQQIGLATGPDRGGGRSVGAWTIAAPPSIERDCPETVAAIGRVVAELAPPPAAATAAPADPMFGRATRWAGLLLLAVALVLVVAVERRSPRVSR